MAFARVVEFDGVSRQRMDEMKKEMEDGGRPDEMPAKEIVVLHDAEAEKSLVLDRPYIIVKGETHSSAGGTE